MAKLVDITGKALTGEWGQDDTDGQGIPVLRTANFTNLGIFKYNNVVTRQISKKNLTEKFLQPGDIVIEKSGGSDSQPVGRVVYFNEEPGRFLFNNFTGLLRVKDKRKWISRYVFYCMYANYQRGGTKPYESKTTGLHNLRLEQYLADLDIPEINLNDQQRIVSELDRITSLISLRKQQLAKLDELVKSQFVEMFGDPATNSMSWPTKRLVDVCSKLTDGTHFSPESFPTGDYRYITAKNIKENGFDFSNITFVTKSVHDGIYARCNPEVGDVLYIKDGVTTGIAMINTLDEPFTMLSSVALLKHRRDLMTGEYLCGALNNKAMYENIRGNMGGAAITRLTIAKLNNIVIPVPPLNLQTQFAAFVAQSDKCKLSVQRSLDKLETLKKALMQKYFG